MMTSKSRRGAAAAGARCSDAGTICLLFLYADSGNDDNRQSPTITDNQRFAGIVPVSGDFLTGS
jgi:hypothetical protein